MTSGNRLMPTGVKYGFAALWRTAIHESPFDPCAGTRLPRYNTLSPWEFLAGMREELSIGVFWVPESLIGMHASYLPHETQVRGPLA